MVPPCSAKALANQCPEIKAAHVEAVVRQRVAGFFEELQFAMLSSTGRAHGAKGRSLSEDCLPKCPPYLCFLVADQAVGRTECICGPAAKRFREAQKQCKEIMSRETTDVAVPDAMLGRPEATSHTCAAFMHLPFQGPEPC